MIDTTKDSSHMSTSLTNNNYSILKKSKELPFFNWFSAFTSNNKTADTTFNKSALTLNRLKGSVPNLDTNFDNIEFLSIPPTSDDYKGVEGLTQYWNHRITFTNNLLQKQTTRAHFKSECNSLYECKCLKSSKSIGCLVAKQKSDDNLENLNFSLDDNRNDENHIKSDNFYKYKTADTNRRISLEPNNRTTLPSNNRETKLLTNNSNSFEIGNRNQTNLSIGIDSFPLIAATERGEKIHWAKREDIFINRKQKPCSSNQHLKKISKQISNSQNNEKIFDEKLLNDIRHMTTENDKVISVRDLINKNKCLFNKKLKTPLNEKVSATIEANEMAIKNTQQKLSTSNNNSSTIPIQISTIDKENNTMNTSKSVLESNQVLQEYRTDTNEDTDKNLLDKGKDKTDNNSMITISNFNQSGSTISLISSSTGSPIKKKNQIPAARKYSFKTNTKNFHVPRKMTNHSTTHHHLHHHHHHQVGGSKVATLTAQFNQLIQKDNSLLDEIKKKNGVILTRGGHIYKIKEENLNIPNIKKKNSIKRTSFIDSTDDTNSIKSAKRKIITKRIPNENCVKATVKIFEESHSSLATTKSITEVVKVSNKNYTVNSKPKIPEKSEIVLKKTKEMNIKNIQKKSRPKSIEIQGSTHLEKIAEESKTPIQEVVDITAPLKDNSSRLLTPNNNSSNNISTDLPENVITDVNNTIPDEVDITPSKKCDEALPKKSRYARIYEKIRFKGTIFAHKRHDAKSPEPNETCILNSEPDRKIREAIETIDKKIETLSKSTNDINIRHKNPDKNESFLYCNKFSFGSNTELTINNNDKITKQKLCEAINTSLVNKTQSMDDSKFPIILNDEMYVTNSCLYNKIERQKENEEENYEKINTQRKNHYAPTPQKSFLFTRFQSQYEPLKINATSKTNNSELPYNYKRSKSVSDSVSADLKSKQPKPFLYASKEFKIYSSASTQSDDDFSNIYQTISEIDDTTNCQNKKTEKVVHDENFELLPTLLKLLQQSKIPSKFNSNPNQTEDGYEICEPPNVINKFEIPVLNLSTDHQQQKLLTSNAIIIPSRIPETQRNTTDELPAIPEPKRNINLLSINNNIEAPPRPNKSPLLNGIKLRKSSLEINTTNTTLNTDNEESKSIISTYDNNHYEDDENIYDTIKGSESMMHCYEMLNNNNNGIQSPKSIDDTISIVSNCYESIASIQRVTIPLMNSDSISTISSDHKTNSLYGVSLNSHNCMPLNESSSDNNDDWIDISDGDEDVTIATSTKPQFIIIREKAKGNKAAEWSALVHNHRIQMEANEDEDYDSDHYYEPLYPTTNKQQSHQMPIDTSQYNDKSASRLIKNHNNQTIATPSENNEKNYNNIALIASNQHTIQQSKNENLYADDYDSFDTDDETDEDVKKNDSGVDISNKKLPEPPSSTNQVYAFVKKFKNFISNKKSVPKSNESGKQYEDTKFFVTPNEYQNTNFNTMDKKLTKKKTPNLYKKAQTPKISNQDNADPYENTDFHRPIRLTKQKSKEEIENTSPIPSSSVQHFKQDHHTSTPILDENSNTNTTTVNRRKSKSESSFKSKIQKSLILNNHQNSESKSGHYSTARSTFYISDSIDLDSGIFEKVANSSSNQTLTESNQQHDLAIAKIEMVKGLSDETVEPTTLGRKIKRNNKSPDLQRRRTTIGIRPNNPPPPPPADKKSSQNKAKRPQTSWYAECGVFKANGLSEGIDSKDQNRNDRSNNTSWYAEAGLYQTSGASVASSSGSSGVSTGGENCPFDDNNSHSMFLNEPLYQIYSAEKLESISREMEDQESTDGYEEISTQHKRPLRPSALQLVGPKCGPSRTLWSEIPEVVNSQILSTLTSQEKRLQEAKFEILTSEASYLKSLNLLRTHFMNHPAFRDANVLNPSDRKTLFSHLVPVHECSDRLLSDLESCWQDNIMLIGLSRSIFKNAEKYFHVYISFCEHQGKMDRTLRRLKEQKSIFSQILDNLEKDPLCYGLNLHSFLMLPMQRITRLPLLIDAVFSKVKTDDSEYESWKMTLAILNKIVSQCNEAANRCEQAYEIERISKQIEFPSSLRSFPIAPVGVLAPGTKPRYLVKRGEFIHLLWRGDDAKLTFGKKFSKINIYAFLFTDLLILTKKKSEEQYTVFDYCSRNMITLSIGDSIPHLPIKDVNQVGKNLILMTLLENHEGKTIEMIISCSSVSEQQRWLEACTPPEPESPGEKLYEQWDCPQVIAKNEYIATEPDLLSLEPGDVINVSRKMPDGWFQGERIRDGVTGWFPGNYTEEVNSAHVRAKNLKQRHRLLTFTASYLEMQKKK